MNRKQSFVDTKIATKYGSFHIRVYADVSGKETLVLYTEKINSLQVPLVRIHSECMTGDTLGSLQCDCGGQLEESLRRISKEGGALVYLRQEGRGIGLFEKIKSYKLQDKGYDTFEANLVLGHRPDERTYEKAKIALSDLHIKRVRLLTNNPAKVSELAKLGIEVIERVPIIIPSNKYNQKYFATKRDKFKHFFHSEVSYYFYQFHADSIETVEQIGTFLKGKKHDPLLKFCVGVEANHATLSNQQEIKRIEGIFHACEFYEGFVPILHFSFRKSPHAIHDIKAIKKFLPFVKYLQTNDLTVKDLPAIKLACRMFLADIPLSDKTFKLVHNKAFRNSIQKNKAFILLDNSLGKGIRESKDSLMKKIDTLTNYGLNDIAIFGGFGPDDLDTYFELRRHYRINFSVDAETKLKTNGHLDMEKTKRYLLQLIRFDDPNLAGVDQTRTFLRQNKPSDWVKTVISGHEFLVHPAVFNPGSFPSTRWFAEVVSKKVKGQSSFCEVGCGTGVISCLVAYKHQNIRIVATDINPFASNNAKVNVKKLGLSGRISVTNGDVLDGLTPGQKFTTIFWALPFGFLDPGATITLEDAQVFDPGYRATRKFFQTAKKHLMHGGKILLGFSTDLGNFDLLKDLGKEARVTFKKVAEKEMKEKETVKFQVLEGTYK